MNLPYELAACPACDSRDEEQIATREMITREVESLWEFHLRRLRPGTPRRCLTDRVVFSQDPPLCTGRCRVCGTLYRNPRERGRELLHLYAEEELEPPVLRALFDAQRRSYATQARRLTSIVGGVGTALEVGSYVGAFQAAGREMGWRVEGVDVNPQAARFARDGGFQVHGGEIGTLSADRRYDAITIWNCFDQLPRPRDTVRAARQRLKPGGVLALRVPNGAFYAALQPHLEGPFAAIARGMLAHSNMLGFPYRTGYTARSLERLLRSEGFVVAAVVGDTLVPTADRWTRGWAHWEERVVKRVLAVVAGGSRAPWIELYARYDPHRTQSVQAND
jgi:2-polyprenyl-3-methyl-5-hydroxy-6-metoxy-1,4-benzoquinol methylase